MADLRDLSGLRRSPLAHLGTVLPAVAGARTVALHEVPFTVMVSIRVDPASAAADRLAEALGVPLPVHCGGTAHGARGTAIWLGPDEWLVIAPGDDAATARLGDDLAAALAGDHGSVVDVSANRTTLELTGPAARAVLEKGCALDLHPRSFGPGQAVSTAVGPVPVVLWHLDDLTYRLLPRASFADYLARWLLDAMSEYEAA
ncbi:MAG TPA: sarcosine oxidase subunit gamma family protein [Kribbellaceae bacterium]|nr:sarcosine oxidase subunit gamma family protein [Kribbellaceae bacterium]